VITLVLGGARSGKSAVAERLVSSSAAAVTYLATGVATDDDMAARIQAHRQRRPASWSTIEVPGPDLPDALRDVSGSVLLDSLTTWVASAPSFAVDMAKLRSALVERDGDSVIVSDEVGLGVHPSTSAGRLFRDALGAVNQGVADVADDVLLVVAGRTLRLT
jgi:adenosylcobinamide kinase / adenosylcobinamide-phosphate guanylyltransferase